MSYTAIVDYGVGNLHSIANALRYLGQDSLITSDAKDLEKAQAIILPGVGAFPDAAQKLQESGLDKVVVEQAKVKPLLGICLGMQLLFDSGEEVRECKGLGLVSGKVARIKTSLKLPHIGWNTLRFREKSALFKDIPENSSVYFVHSFAAEVARENTLLATTDYGGQVTAAVGEGWVYGCQFHPEKSGEVGLAILKNFGELSK